MQLIKGFVTFWKGQIGGGGGGGEGGRKEEGGTALKLNHCTSMQKKHEIAKSYNYSTSDKLKPICSLLTLNEKVTC